MSKTIDLQVDKTMRLVDGVKAHLNELLDKGVDAHVLDDLVDKTRHMKQLDQECDALHDQLSAKTRAKNDILNSVKTGYADLRKILHDNYPQEEWEKYGLLDKR